MFRPEDSFMYEPAKNRFLLGALKRERKRHGLDAVVNLFAPVPLGRAKPKLAYRIEGNPLKGYDITLGVEPKDYIKLIGEAIARIKTKMLSGGVYGGSFMSEDKYYDNGTQ